MLDGAFSLSVSIHKSSRRPHEPTPLPHCRLLKSKMPPRAQHQAAQRPRNLVRSRIGLAIVALVVSRLVVFLSWAGQAFWPVSLPDFWARGAPACHNLHASQLDASIYNDKPLTGIASKHQELSFCEDAEDIGSGWVLFSCDLNRGHWNTVMGPLRDPRPRGGLWVWSAASGATSEPHLLPLTGYPLHADFHPLGTSYHAGSGRLFVVNHGREAGSIEVFDITRGDESDVASRWEALYVRTLRHPLATHTPNSLVALSPYSVLVTNDHLFARRPPTDLEQLRATYAQLDVASSWLPPSMQASTTDALARLASNALVANIAPRLETMLGLPGGWVAQLRFNDDDENDVQARMVARNIPFANGVALSPDGATLAVASTTSPAVRLYGLPSSGATDGDGWLPTLGSRRGIDYDEVAMPFTPDNLGFAAGKGDNTWRLTVAGHANPLQLLRLAAQPYDDTRSASSWVVAVDVVDEADGVDGSEDDVAGPVPACKQRTRVVAGRRASRSNDSMPLRYRVRTLYQGSGGEVNGAGVRSSTTGIFVEGQSKDESTLVVPGLYARGVLVCKGISL